MTHIPRLLFGTAGIPLSTPNRDTINGITHIKTLNLDAMELEFVRSINISQNKAPLIKEHAKQHNVILTCHGQYFINLNAKDDTTVQQSIKRILDASERANQAGAWSICYHMAYYMKDPPSQVYDKVKHNVKQIVKQLQDTNNPIWLRPETGGKINQFADIDDLIRLSQDIEQILPCIDWAHHYARSLGKTNSLEQFKTILEKIERHLGKTAIHNMHMHLEGIEYTDKGERNHVNVNESPFNYKAVLQALKEYNVKGVLTCESPHIEQDAILFKKTYETI